MRLLAIDPGETVGWAVGRESYQEGSYGVLLEGWDEFPSQHADERLQGIFETWEIEGVVIERPSMKPRVGGADASREVGRDIANICSEAGAWIAWQTASDAKGVMHNERLKAMDLWVRGKPHARDAIRHLVIAIRRQDG